MKNIPFGCRFTACLMLLAVIIGWRNIALVFEHHQATFIIVLGSLFFILNSVAAVGLYFVKRMGFYCAYIAIVFSTFFFSTSYIPLISKIIPVMITNLVVLFYLVYLNILYERIKKV